MCVCVCVLIEIVGFLRHLSSKHRIVQAQPFMRKASLYCLVFVHIIKQLVQRQCRAMHQTLAAIPLRFPQTSDFRAVILSQSHFLTQVTGPCIQLKLGTGLQDAHCLYCIFAYLCKCVYSMWSMHEFTYTIQQHTHVDFYTCVTLWLISCHRAITSW